ncbi:MAG: glycerol kinase GlpK [Pseudomonadota bacterium]
MSQPYILAIDEGTSSTRSVIYDHQANVVASVQKEFEQHYPQPGWVEHDPEEIWSAVVEVSNAVIQKAGIEAGDIAAIGITNQRETTVAWDRQTGECLYNAIVWQDRRTADVCEQLRGDGVERDVIEKTGLRLDPYFSGTKIAWILNHVEGARELADAGRLAIGTIDCFLIWRLTDGAVHATDATNASRTLLFNIRTQAWDDDLLQLLNIPHSVLPDVRDCAADYGVAGSGHFGAPIPIRGVAGDQQSALIGQAGFEPGMSKSTYGTGCFVLTNTGDDAPISENQLLTTVASRLDGKVAYGLEGSVFVAGSAMQWLRDELQLIDSAPESEAIAVATGVVEDVVVVPAFTGLGAPYWDPYARGAVFGLTRGSNRERIVTATLQAVALQTADLLSAMADDGVTPSVIRVDGGMVKNDWFLQFLADILNTPVERPKDIESTVLGAAFLAGLDAGVFDSTDAVSERWQQDALFEPQMADALREQLLAGWADAISRVRVNDT